MSKYSELFAWLRTCPALADLWSIAATEDAGVSGILPQGSSQSVAYNETLDVLGGYNCDVRPYPSVYEDYQINCYTAYDANDSSAPQYNLNVLNLDDVQGIIDWITAKNEAHTLPSITGERVVSVECMPRVPQIRYVNTDESVIAYFITVRVRYVNKAKRWSVEL